ncbi:MAG: hypothetical protein ABID54_14260 [Pseudomonadota bacterium]
MANTALSEGFVFKKSLVGIGAPMEETVLTSNNIIAVGDALGAASGKAVIADATSTGILGVSETTQATSVTVNVSVLYIPAVPWYVFKAQTDATFSQGNMFGQMGITATTGDMKIDVGDDNATSIAWPIGLIEDGETEAAANREILFVWKRSKFNGIGM